MHKQEKLVRLALEVGAPRQTSRKFAQDQCFAS